VAALIVAAAAWAQMQQPKPYKVVFDLTTDDPQDQTAVLRWLREVASVNSRSEMEVVRYGRGLALLVPGRSAMTDDVTQAIAGPCRSRCGRSQCATRTSTRPVAPNVSTVPDGIREIVARQKEGQGYIKVVAH